MKVRDVMVDLYEWSFDGIMLWGYCCGHKRLGDGTYVHTSHVRKIELCGDGIDVYTRSGTHYHCKTEDVKLGDELHETKREIEGRDIDSSFLNNVLALKKKKLEEYKKELAEVLEEQDLYIEFIGSYAKKAYFKQNGKVFLVRRGYLLDVFENSYLLSIPQILDVRYFLKGREISFCNISEGIKRIYIKYNGNIPFRITGINDGAMIFKDGGMRAIKVKKANEGLCPDCVNGNVF